MLSILRISQYYIVEKSISNFGVCVVVLGATHKRDGCKNQCNSQWSVITAAVFKILVQQPSESSHTL